MTYSCVMVYLAGDHRGFLRKEEIKKFLEEAGKEYQDLGNVILDPNDDEVDFVNKAGEKIEAAYAESSHLHQDFGGQAGEPRGIFFCGSGVMVDVAANKFPKIRSCLAFDKKQVEMARNDDNVNVLCIATNFFDLEETKTMVKAFLNTPFSREERFVRRIGKLHRQVSSS